MSGVHYFVLSMDLVNAPYSGGFLQQEGTKGFFPFTTTITHETIESTNNGVEVNFPLYC